ncbi:MAG: xanthine dehydrogenase family protein molybdopterin-binding subunit [Sulfurifustis sp.]
MQKFGMGQPAARVEDRRLLTGNGRYLDDVNLDGQVWGVFVRSPHAHARIASIDTSGARSLPGVLAVYTADDLAADGIGDVPCLATAIKNRDGSAFVAPPRPALARARARHVGDAVAFIVAQTRLQALDAAEQVMVDYEPLPAIVDTGSALNDGAAQVWDEAPRNLCLDWEAGDEKKTADAFARAARIVSLDLVNNRVVPNSMETRGAIAEVERGTGRLVLHVSCQGVHVLRRPLAERIFHVAEKDIQVLCHDVGGGFGMKIFLYPEYVATMYAARKLGRPVKWIAERGEAFASDSHGRDHVSHLELALDKNARFLGLRVGTVANLGAYLSNYAPFVATAAGVPMLVGCYDIPAAHVRVRGVFTNTNPVDAYRGAGRPEAIYAIERLVDAAARELGLSPIEIRKRNLIPSSAMPYTTALGSLYDSGDFVRNLNDAVKLARWEEFEARRKEARARGRLRGIGVATYIERCAGGAPEQARLTVDAHGHVTLYIGTQSNGQGHETSFRQIIAERLGVAFEDVTVVQGDSDRIATGGGTMGSRSVPVGGAAVSGAAFKVIDAAKRKAADMLEASAVDIEFVEGVFRIAGTDRRVSLREVARAAAPADGGASFDERETWTPSNPTYPNGTHICELEVDRDTGAVEVIDYTVVDDFGKTINPLLIAGQVHGGVAQGLGQALLERCVYEPESGQLLSASFMDYALPRADNLPSIRFKLNEVPSTTNALGIKGAGEAGAIGAPPAIMNALVDALAESGVRHVDMPATPEKIWRLIHGRG